MGVISPPRVPRNELQRQRGPAQLDARKARSARFPFRRDIDVGIDSTVEKLLGFDARQHVPRKQLWTEGLFGCWSIALTLAHICALHNQNPRVCKNNLCPSP